MHAVYRAVVRLPVINDTIEQMMHLIIVALAVIRDIGFPKVVTALVKAECAGFCSFAV